MRVLLSPLGALLSQLVSVGSSALVLHSPAPALTWNWHQSYCQGDQESIKGGSGLMVNGDPGGFLLDPVSEGEGVEEE